MTVARSAMAADPARLAALALDSLRQGDGHRAWLLADSFYRQAPAARRIDALLLRATALMRLGDAEAAARDIDLAEHIDPLDPTVNTALLGHADPARRSRAARRLLNAERLDPQFRGWSALAAEGYACVGHVSPADDMLHVTLAWRGIDPLAISVLSDLGGTSLLVEPGADHPPQGFDSAATTRIPVPAGASAVALSTPAVRALFEPATILLPAGGGARPAADGAPEDGLVVIVPVYDDVEATRACLNSLFEARPAARTTRILVVDDVSPDPAIGLHLEDLAAEGKIELLRNRLNLGFAASVNSALKRRPPGWDALLLNADTILPPGAIDRLAAHLASPDIGTVTPLSNNGEDTSVPRRFQVNPMPTTEDIVRVDRLARRANEGLSIDIPNGVGFCLYIRGEVIDRVGQLSHEFGRGYYEDVEFCLRAATAGYRNVCAADVYVGHQGGRSFAGEKRALVAVNLRRLERRYPDYRERARSFEAEDPVAAAVARIEAAWLATGKPFDLVIALDDLPGSFAAFAASSLAGPSVLARVEQGREGLTIAMTAPDGTFPQSIRWSFAGPLEDVAERIHARLAKFPLRSVGLLGDAALPSPLAVSLSRLRCPVHRVTADIDAHARHSTGAFRAPSLGRRPILAAVMVEADEADRAYVRWLARDIAPTVTIVATGGTPSAADGALIAAGPVPDAELPDWLDRLEAGGVLFASRRWGHRDPRAHLWCAAGVPVVWRDADILSPECVGTSLRLPAAIEANGTAAALLAWLGLAPAAGLPGAQRVDQHAVQSLVTAG